MSDFMSYWQINERPFEATWDARFFFGSPTHLDAFNSLLYLALERSLHGCVLTGGIGCGKTLTKEVFTQQLDRRYFNIVTMENGVLNFDELLQTLTKALEPYPCVPPADRHACTERLGYLLQQYHLAGRHTVLIIDEAQDIPPATMRELRYLTNYNRAGQTCLTTVLIGQPELLNMLAGDPALHQRMSLRLHLPPLGMGETDGYLAHRLRVAGHADGRVFTTDSVEIIESVTGRIPREINRVAKLAMEHAWAQQKSQVDCATLEAVIRHFIKYQEAAAA